MESNSQNSGRDEVREQLVQAARQVFVRFGYKKTALDDIAREARKGKSTIYYYFKSKDDIFKAVIDAEAEIRAKTIDDQISTIDDPQQKLKTYIYVRMLTLQKVGNYYEAIKNDLLDNLYFVNSLRTNHFDAEINLVKELLLEGIEKEVYTIQNPELTAKTIVTLLQGFEVPLILKNLSDEELQKSVDEMLNILFFGIVAKK
ncbi:transcriptional regulator, TetR family [Aquipluma nitroreducens]|uniref:Transcriptional regulator, TetR family n=1 Tax=Aquipluma nitroreducens TaxID=2010828 RepID=A0A5K7S9V3_9BACT|nr:TetR/AcrR family transcriptional regulator [Aquipluma nitroreducens]BBE18352.1 transcriptional regulator, TetR family [Aquipluma nitroreducens]